MACHAFGVPISRSTLAKIEAEMRKISEIELYVLSKSLGIHMDDVFPANTRKIIRKFDKR